MMTLSYSYKADIFRFPASVLLFSLVLLAYLKTSLLKSYRFAMQTWRTDSVRDVAHCWHGSSLYQ